MFKRSWWGRFLLLALGMTIARYGNGWIALVFLIFLLAEGCLRKEKVDVLAVIAICFAVGWLNYSWRIPEIPHYLEDMPERTWSGIVRELKQDEAEEKSTWKLQTDSAIPWLTTLYINAYGSFPIQEGDLIQITGRLRIPSEPRNPGEFDYRQYLADQQIYYQMSVYEESDMQVIQKNAQSPSFLKKWKENRIEDVRSLLDAEQSGILLGMILGDKENIPDEAYSAFQKTGTVHLLAVSGLHVGFLLLFIEWLFKYIPIGKGKKRLLQGILLLGYGFLTEWPVTIQRAVLMTGLALLAAQWGRNRHGLDVLGLAGILIVLHTPTALFGISFQLSFAAVWGILYLLPKLEEKIPYQHKVIKALLLTVAVEIAILPVSMYYFQMCSVSSFFINPIAVWIGAGVILLGLLGFLFSSFGMIFGAVFLYPSSWLLTLLTSLVTFISHVHGSYFWTPQPSLILVILYYILLTLIFIPYDTPLLSKFRKPGLAGAVILWLMMFLPQQRVDGELHLTFLDVGQGNCLFLQTPEGEQWMIDGGGSEFYDLGESIVIPWIHRQGIREIDWMVSTHPDTDHLQGLEAASRTIPVHNLLLPASQRNQEAYAELIQSVTKSGGNIWYVKSGQSWSPEEKMLVEIWHPESGDVSSIGKEESTNEESVVMKLTCRAFSILITGDVGTDTLEKIMQKSFVTPVTLVQVPHHGSRHSYSEWFYEKIQPEISVVQSKPDNLYGHPHEEVVKALESETLFLRSDISGCIRIDTNDGLWQVDCFLRD